MNKTLPQAAGIMPSLGLNFPVNQRKRLVQTENVDKFYDGDFGENHERQRVSGEGEVSGSWTATDDRDTV